MKKLLCFLLCSVLIFSNVSLSFAATQDVSDAQTHTQLGNIYNLLSGTSIAGRLNTINNYLDDINYNLVTLMGWLDPSNGGGTTALLNQILNALVYTNAGGSAISYLTDLRQENQIQSNYLQSIRQYTSDASSALWATVDLHYITILPNGQLGTFPSGQTNFTNMIQDRLTGIINTLANIYSYEYAYSATGYNTQQSLVSFADLDSTVTFTPTSVADGIYKYLNALNTPLARLSYVLASDERIEAQEAAASNEEAVVDNFIDSSGDGAASPSDIRSVSDLSSGYKQNFGTDASPSGIFDIFNADHASWFSQETKNQLDTTTPTRLTKGSNSETPLLDKQIDDIYNALGVKQP